jgi:hypothetical protein
MNGKKVVVAGAVGGVVLWLVDFVFHGVLMGGTYMKYPEVFAQEQSHVLHLLLVEVCLGIGAALLFARTRNSWAPGWSGGATFGFFLGLFAFWLPFFDPMVIEGFPYYMAWCHGGMAMIGAVVLGAVLGAIIKT